MKIKPILTACWDNRIKLSIVAFMTVLHFFSLFQRVAVPGTIFNELQSDFATSAIAITLLGAIGIYIYASMQVFAGIMADRFGAARVLLTGAAIMTVGAILFPLSHSLTALYVAQSLVGFGAGLIFVSLVKEIDELFGERHFAMVLSITAFLGYTGWLAATFPLERAVSAFGWRRSMLTAGILGGIVLVCTWWLLHKTKGVIVRNRSSSLAGVADVLLNKSALPLQFSGAITFSIYFLLQAAIGKKLLQDFWGFSSAIAAFYTLLMALTNMMGLGISGFLSRLMGNRRRPLLIGSTAVMFASTVCFTFILWKGLDRRWVLPCCILLAASASFSPIWCATMKELNRPDSAATSIGLLNGVSYLFMAIAMNSAGIIMDMHKAQSTVTATAIIYPAGAYITILTGCSVLALFSLMASLFIKETFGKSIYGEKVIAANGCA
ncbi:MAG: MFS transporter [Sedimentisphaerales bacterium]|nr:MFS transporter [Sedimentisphaerales bacterium]